MRLITGKLAELPASDIDLEQTAELFGRVKEMLMGASELPFMTARIPSGGGIMFELPGDAPDQPDVSRDITGIILSYHYVNEYYESNYSGGNASPDCVSRDGISGWDKDGMENVCARCPKNRMGSASDGRGKACRNKVMLYVLREGEALPLQLKIPTMSVGNFTAYVLRQLVPRGLEPRQVETRITLSKATNKLGTVYSQAQFQAIARVDDEQLSKLWQGMAPLIAPGEVNLLTEGD